MESIGNMLSPKGGILLSPHVPAMIQAKETKVKAIRPHHTSHVRCSLPFYHSNCFLWIIRKFQPPIHTIDNQSDSKFNQGSRKT